MTTFVAHNVAQAFFAWDSHVTNPRLMKPFVIRRCPSIFRLEAKKTNPRVRQSQAFLRKCFYFWLLFRLGLN